MAQILLEYVTELEELIPGDKLVFDNRHIAEINAIRRKSRQGLLFIVDLELVRAGIHSVAQLIHDPRSGIVLLIENRRWDNVSMIKIGLPVRSKLNWSYLDPNTPIRVGGYLFFWRPVGPRLGPMSIYKNYESVYGRLIEKTSDGIWKIQIARPEPNVWYIYLTDSFKFYLGSTPNNLQPVDVTEIWYARGTTN